MRRSIIAEFDALYKDYQNKTAIVAGEDTLSFEQMVCRAVDLAGRLISAVENSYGNPIGVFMPKCIDAIIADVAISYSSNIFMNLDVKMPLSRLENIILQIQPKLIVSQMEYRDRLDGFQVPVLYIDEMAIPESLDEAVHEQVIEHLKKQIDTDPFCIINTSGSTGTPKGVVLSHRSFLDYYSWAVETFPFDQSTTIGSLSPLFFDHYIFELCLMLLSGATFVILDPNLAAFPARLLQTVIQTEVNFIFWVPTIMVNIANMDLLTKLNLTGLKMIWFAGEVFSTKQFNYWKRSLPDAVFVNLYGPAEITVDCTYYVVEDEIDEDKPIPIGYACSNTDVLILNDENQLCQSGEVGELCVRGTSLAMGYYNNQEKTAAVFVQNPLNASYPELIYRTGDLAYADENGLIFFKGRKDSLIKHMGYRIELAEIEHIAVNTLKLVKNCCVVYNYAKKAITMIYEKNGELTSLMIKKELANHLPRYMVPADYIEVEILPRNNNGKIDRLTLSKRVSEET